MLQPMLLQDLLAHRPPHQLRRVQVVEEEHLILNLELLQHCDLVFLIL